MLCVLSTMMVVASTAVASTWVKMNPVSFWIEAKTKPVNDPILNFDADSISVDWANHTVDVVITIEHSPYNGYREIRNERLTLYADSTNSKARVRRARYYDKNGTLMLESDMGGYAFADAGDLSARYGKYHINNELQREFGYFLNLPNEDGRPYLTPKALGLTWIKSTADVGVFYYPQTVKVKNNNVNVKVAFWYPRQNRIQTINCTLDYDKKLFKPKSCEMRRINTGEIIESVSKGLIPGLIGPRFINHRFDQDDEARILSDYFRAKIEG